MIDTTRWNEGRQNMGAVRQQVSETTALRRVRQPDDVVEVVKFLVNEADYVTAAVVTVDGGRELI